MCMVNYKHNTTIMTSMTRQAKASSKTEPSLKMNSKFLYFVNRNPGYFGVYEYLRNLSL